LTSSFEKLNLILFLAHSLAGCVAIPTLLPVPALSRTPTIRSIAVWLNLLVESIMHQPTNLFG